jgi:mannose-6-phosphate isomerase-like protein (cupin superfamily)
MTAAPVLSASASASVPAAATAARPTAARQTADRETAERHATAHWRTPPVGRAGAAGIAVALALHPELWQPLVQYREGSRWTSLLDPARAAAVLDPSQHEELAGAQVWLLSWLPGQGTPLHDHGQSAGAFAVAGGTLTERVVTSRPGAPLVATDLTTGRVRWFGPHHVHQVHNSGAEPAVSIHVYTPPLRLMNTYRVEPTGLIRTGTERAGVDW